MKPASFPAEQFTPKIFTILKNGYSAALLRADLVAGLTVAIVALPLAMALAIASGASPDKGLITAVVAGFVISFLGGSRVQIGGPTGAFVVVVFGVIAQHGYDGLVLATLLAGIILIIAGYARLGQAIKFIPHPVVTGFTAGIAVIIATSQVKDFFGLQLENPPADFILKWAAYLAQINSIDLTTTAIGLSSLLLIVFLRRAAPKWPGYLLAVIVAAFAVWGLALPVETIGSRFPDLPHGLPAPEWPDWSFEKIKDVLPAAFTIAFLAGIEALLSALVADSMAGYKHRSNQELVAQGAANIASALMAGLPATGAIARTATNIKAGGKTPFSGIFHALFLLVFMVFAMDIVAYIPLSALAAILFVVAWGMSEMRHFIRIFKMSASDRAVLLLTFILTVLVDLTVAIGVGVTLASVLFMAQMSKTIEIGAPGRRKTDINQIYEEDETQRDDLPEGVEVLRLAGPVFFGVADDVMDAIKSIGRWPKILIIRMRYVPYLDVSGEAVIENIIRECAVRGTHVFLSSVQPQPLNMLAKAGIANSHANVTIAPSYAAAIDMAKHQLGINGSL